MKKKFLLGLVSMLLPLTSWAANELTVTVTNADKSVVYNGDNTKDALTIEVYSGDTKLTENTHYKLKYSNTPNKVGEFTVEAVGIDGTYLGQTGSDEFKVTPKVVNKRFSFDHIEEGGVSKTYGQDDQVVLTQLVSLDELEDVLVAEEDYTNFLLCLEVARQTGTSDANIVGDYTIYVKGKETSESNYKYITPETATYTTLHIGPATLKAKITQMPIYRGSAWSLSWFATENKYEFTEGLLEDDKSNVTISDFTSETPIINAGTYNLKATLAGNAAGNYTIEDVEFIVKKKNLTFTAKTTPVAAVLTKVYDRSNANVEVTNQFNITGIVDADATLQTTLKLFAEIEGTENNGNVYDEYAIALYQKEESEDGDDENPTYTKVTSLTNYDFTNPEDNYKITAKTIETAWITIADDDLTYQGQFFDATGKVTVQYTDGEETVTLTEAVDYKDIKVMAETDANGTDAGTRFKVAVTGLGNYAGTDVKSNFFTITKAELTITAPEDESVLRKVYDGKRPGDLSEHFTFVGLLGDDNDGNDKPKDSWMTLNTSVGTVGKNRAVNVYVGSNVVSAAKYESKDPKEGLQNYILYYTRAMFEILDNNFVLKGGEYTTDEEGEALEGIVTNTEKINQYTGLEVPEVKIEELASLNNAGYQADRWYTLVLPFEVTVREISAQFGYAIVNVPQESNDDPETMVFRLTMGTIPAHTPMAFKVDATNTDNEGEEDYRKNPTLSFDKKEIVAIPENWFTDEQGNKAIGTYEPKYIDGEKEFFLIPGGTASGNFRRGSVTPMTITPLNVYFDFNKTPGNNARLILEEADGSTTAINALTGETIHNAAEGWYTIGGVKLNAQPTEKGVYINNGMKVVIK